MIPRPLTIEPSEEQIQHAAYYLWEAEGKPAGRDLEIWLTAKERLRHRLPELAVPAHRATRAMSKARNAQPRPGGIR